MQKIHKKYEDTVAKLTGRLGSLQEENERDEAIILELKEAYAAAIVGDDPSASKLKQQFAEKQEVVADRTEQIELLQAGKHPAIKKAANDAVRAYAKERSKHEVRGEKLNAELQKAKSIYLDAVAKAYVEDKKNLAQRGTMRSLLREADDEVVSELLLNRERDERTGEINGFFKWYDCLVREDELHIAARKHE